MRPKNKHSTILNTWLDAVDKRRKYFKTKDDKIFCDPCSTLYDFKQLSHLKQHIESVKHVKNARRHDLKPEQQMLLTENKGQPNPFYEDLCQAFVSAGIAWNKLSNSHLRTFLEKYTTKSIPDESTLRKNYLKRVYAKSVDYIRDLIGNNYVWMSIDETTDSKGQYVANVLVGAMIKDDFGKPFLLMCKKLEKTNNCTITQLILDSCAFLWPNASQAEISGKFLLFITDGVAYMKLAGKNLKSIYPDLIHVTCLAHEINLVAEDIRSHYPAVDKLVGAVKAVFKKSPARILAYKEKCSGLDLPPSPIYTRWGTWLSAVEFYAQHFDEVLEVVQSFSKTEAKCIETAQLLFSNEGLRSELSYMSANFTFLADTLLEIQERNSPLSESLSIVENVKIRLEKVNGEIGKKVHTKFNAILSKNEGYKIIEDISGVLDGKVGVGTMVNHLSPAKLAAFKYAPVTSVEAERSFSMHKRIFEPQRQCMTMENVEMTLVSHFAFN